MVLQLSNKEKALVLAILQKNLSNTEVWVFGSRMTLSAEQYADLDLCLKGQKPIPLSVLSSLGEDFAESTLPYSVDLVDWHRISPEFQQHILHQSIRIL